MRPRFAHSERGTTLAELMIALVVLTIGVLAVAQLFPAGSRSEQQSRLSSSASYYAQEQLEVLKGQHWSSAALTNGRHPAAGYDSTLTGGKLHRYYEVSTLAAPLNNLKQVTVTVEWTYMRARSITATTYVRQ